MAAAFVAVFSPPSYGMAATIGWMMATYFLLATLYSLFAVPYVAIPSEESVGDTWRARLVAWRMFVAMIGVLAGAGLVPHIVELSGGGREGYHRMSLLMAAACWVAMLAPLWMLRGRDPARSSASRTRASVTRQLLSVLRNRAFVLLSLAYVLQLTAVGVISAGAPYLITGALHRSEGDIGTAMIGMLAATTVAIPLWAGAARRWGAPRSLVLAVLVFGAGAIWIGVLAFARPDWFASRVGFAIAGLGFAGMQVLPYTIVATLIHDAAAAAEAGESSFAGMWTAAEKLGLAFGPALTGIVLALWPAHKTSAVTSLVLVGPMLLGLFSIPLLMAAIARGRETAGAVDS
jgi:Na+/melibiose symporter-like transporter